MPSNHLILCHPLLLLLSIFPSIGVFSDESVLCIRWPEYWNFSFSISPSNEYSDGFPTGWTGWISQKSSPTPQFKSINSLALSLLYSTTLNEGNWNAYSERSQSIKDTNYMIPTIWHSWKGKSVETIKDQSFTGTGKDRWLGRAQRIFRTVKWFYMIQWWIQVTHLSKLRMYNVKSEP